MSSIPFPLPPREADSHKGDFGRILIVAGSWGMTGAAVLTATACVKSGAGLVSVACPASCLPLIATAHPSAMTIAWPETAGGLALKTAGGLAPETAGGLALETAGGLAPETAGGKFSFAAWQALRQTLSKYDVIAFGPGVGKSNVISRMAGTVFTQTDCQAVIDADGLNGLAQYLKFAAVNSHPPALSKTSGTKASGVEGCVLTPHVGEFQRLWQAVYPQQDWPQSPSRSWLEAQTVSLSATLGCVVLLKGRRTFVTDGQRHFHNSTGNPGMASGGTGDCLTGVIAALLAVMPSAFEAACLGCYAHGLAGDVAAAASGQTAMTSSDLAAGLPAAWQAIQGKS